MCEFYLCKTFNIIVSQLSQPLLKLFFLCSPLIPITIIIIALIKDQPTIYSQAACTPRNFGLFILEITSSGVMLGKSKADINPSNKT